jgi:N-acetylmuramidase-like protein
MRFKGAAQRMRDDDLPRIGSKIGVGEDEMHAFLEVEARGSGFDSAGRPKMLFEPHIFYRELGAGSKRDRAVREGLAYPKWGQQKYPSDSYPRLARAIEIDEVAALRSCSWGIGQVMGFNHKLAGFPTVHAMIEAMMDSEAAGLEASVNFIRACKLDDELRAHDWAGFARGYNGEKYAQHGYHTKLKAAYEKWAKIKDTPWDGKPTPAEPKPAPTPLPAGPPKPAPKPAPKPPLKPPVKRSIFAVIAAAIVAFFTGVGEWIAAHPTETTVGVVAIVAAIVGGIVLRRRRRKK